MPCVHERNVHVELAGLERDSREPAAQRSLSAAQESRNGLGERVLPDPREKAAGLQPLEQGEGRRSGASPELEDVGRPGGGESAHDGFRAETIVDRVQEVVVLEVVEPQREAGGREEDLLAGLLPFEIVDDVPRELLDDRECRRARGVDRESLFAGPAVGRRMGVANAVARRARPRGRLEEPFLGELREHPFERRFRARGVARSGERFRGARGFLERAEEPEPIEVASGDLGREAVEMDAANHEVPGKEGPDGRVERFAQIRREGLERIVHAANRNRISLLWSHREAARTAVAICPTPGPRG